MLVLSRGEGENIVIGNDIKVTVLEIHSGRVQLGIDAPKNISVHKQETYEKIQEALQHGVAKKETGAIQTGEQTAQKESTTSEGTTLDNQTPQSNS